VTGYYDRIPSIVGDSIKGQSGKEKLPTGALKRFCRKNVLLQPAQTIVQTAKFWHYPSPGIFSTTATSSVSKNFSQRITVSASCAAKQIQMRAAVAAVGLERTATRERGRPGYHLTINTVAPIDIQHNRSRLLENMRKKSPQIWQKK